VFGKGNAAVLGNRSWYINAGALVSQADVEGLETDTGFTLSTGWNIPVSQHVDFNVGFGYSQQSGTVEFIEEVPYTVYDRRYYYTYFYRYTYLVPRTAYRSVLVEEEFDVSTFAGLGALALHAAPGQPVNPFLVGGVYYVNQEVEVGYISASESDTGFSVGGGVEFIMGDQVSFIPSVVHSKAGDAEETSINALLTYWYAMPSAVRFSGAYGTESENILISLGYMYMY
ncbi:MAG: opacity protein-like surface antigen, partial [Candidatus Omnitrophota bacterium]